MARRACDGLVHHSPASETDAYAHGFGPPPIVRQVRVRGYSPTYTAPYCILSYITAIYRHHIARSMIAQRTATDTRRAMRGYYYRSLLMYYFTLFLSFRIISIINE